MTSSQTAGTMNIAGGGGGGGGTYTGGAGININGSNVISILPGAVTDAMLAEDYIKADGSRPLTANWAAGNFTSTFNGVVVGGDRTTTAAVQVTSTGLGVTPSNFSGVSLINTTAAANNAQQISPSLRMTGNGWSSTSSASQAVDFRFHVVPVQGTTNPSGIFTMQNSINGGSYNNVLQIYSSGGFIINPDGLTGVPTIAMGNGMPNSTVNFLTSAFQTSVRHIISFTGSAGNPNIVFGSANFAAGIYGSDSAVASFIGLSTGGTERIRINHTGQTGFGITPTATLHLKAGSTTAGSAPIKLTAGTLLSIREVGALEMTADNLYFTRDSSNRNPILAGNVVNGDYVNLDTTTALEVYIEGSLYYIQLVTP